MRPGRGWLYQGEQWIFAEQGREREYGRLEDQKTRSTLESGVAEGWTKESEDELSRVGTE